MQKQYGKKYIEQGKYETVIARLRCVSVSDICYDEAQELIFQHQGVIISEMILDMEKVANEKVWKRVITLCDRGNIMNPDAYDWQNAREQYMSALLQQVLAKLDNEISNGNYETAKSYH